MIPVAASLVVLALTALSVQSCEPGSQTSPPAPESAAMTSEPLEMTPVFSSANSGFAGAEELVIRDQAALERAMQNARHGVLVEPTEIVIDFSRDMVILVALGQRSTGGYGIRIDSVSRENDGALVRYTATSPGPTCMTTQALTSPVDAVAIPRVSGEIRFQREQVVVPC